MPSGLGNNTLILFTTHDGMTKRSPFSYWSSDDTAIENRKENLVAKVPVQVVVQDLCKVPLPFSVLTDCIANEVSTEAKALYRHHVLEKLSFSNAHLVPSLLSQLFNLLTAYASITTFSVQCLHKHQFVFPFRASSLSIKLQRESLLLLK